MDQNWNEWLVNIVQFGLLPVSTALITQVVSARQALNRARLVHYMEVQTGKSATECELAESLHELLSEYQRSIWFQIIHRLETGYYSSDEQPRQNTDQENEDRRMAEQISDTANRIRRIVAFHFGQFNEHLANVFESQTNLVEKQSIAKGADSSTSDRKAIADVIRALAETTKQIDDFRQAIENAFGSAQTTAKHTGE